jgi:hypothetical protein
MHRPDRLRLAALAAAALALTLPPVSGQGSDCMEGLSAQRGEGSAIVLRWVPEPGATAYQVLVRPVGGSWAPIEPQVEAPATSWTDQGVPPGATVQYTLVAMMGEAQGRAYCPVVQSAAAEDRSAPERGGAAPPAAAIGLVAALACVGVATVALVRRK